VDNLDPAPDFSKVALGTSRIQGTTNQLAFSRGDGGVSSATWRPNLPYSGRYRVYAWWWSVRTGPIRRRTRSTTGRRDDGVREPDRPGDGREMERAATSTSTRARPVRRCCARPFPRTSTFATPCGLPMSRDCTFRAFRRRRNVNLADYAALADAWRSRRAAGSGPSDGLGECLWRSTRGGQRCGRTGFAEFQQYSRASSRAERVTLRMEGLAWSLGAGYTSAGESRGNSRLWRRSFSPRKRKWPARRQRKRPAAS